MNLQTKVYYADNSKVTPVRNEKYEAWMLENNYKENLRGKELGFYEEFLGKDHPKQDLPGFDQRYHNWSFYIIEITHRIWEEWHTPWAGKDMGYQKQGAEIIRQTYHPEVKMHFGKFDIGGAGGLKMVIDGTAKTLDSFSDRFLHGEEVIWYENDKGELLSSHRIYSEATNNANSDWGPASGKSAQFRTIADCKGKDNKLFEEWLVRDNYTFVKQNGFDPHKIAKERAKLPLARIWEDPKFDAPSPDYKAKNNKPCEFIKELFGNIYNGQKFDKLSNYYHEDAKFNYIENKRLHSHQEIATTLKNLIDSFDDFKIELEEIIVNTGNKDGRTNVAVRWWMKGKNSGKGFFTCDVKGSDLEILGVSHLYLKDGKVEEEYIVFDGMEFLRQIYKGE